VALTAVRRREWHRRNGVIMPTHSRVGLCPGGRMYSVMQARLLTRTDTESSRTDRQIWRFIVARLSIASDAMMSEKRSRNDHVF